MTGASATKGWFEIPLERLADTTTRVFEPIVSTRVRERAERQRHARLLAVLTIAGLAAALGMPVAGLCGDATHLVVASAGLASLCLILASLLVGTAAFEPVLGAAIGTMLLLVAVGAVLTGGILSPLVWLLPILPAECLLKGAKRLFRFGIVMAGLAAGLVFGADWLGLVPDSEAPRLGMEAVLAVGAAYLALRGLVLARTARRAGTARRAEAALVDAMTGRIVARFSTDGALVSASPAATAAFGANEGARHQPFALQAVHVADRVAYLAAFGAVRSGAPAASCVARVSGDNGQSFTPIELRLAASPVAPGAAPAILVVGQEQRQAGPIAGELEAALREAKGVSEAKSSFLAMVSHELRTPLNAIIGFSDVLDQEFFGGFDDPRQKEYVGLIRQSGEHLLSVVNGLLDISKIEAGHYELIREPFDLGEVLAAAVAAVRGEADRKGLGIVCRNGCGDLRPNADRRAVQQILLNLLSNAVKFTEAGRVTVTTAVIDDHLELHVADTGPGIAANELPHLGKPFAQGSCGLARRYPGTGLGLSLVKGFAELHGGSMTLASEFGSGTTVSVRIRLDQGEDAVDTQETDTRIVALKHARTHENPTSPLEARRSA